jgi:hypothetical protein
MAKRRMDEDFSIILGKKAIGSGSEKKEAIPPRKPVPKEPEAPSITKQSLEQLLKKKEEMETFMHSLEDAHTNSKFPEYTYERLKKKVERELINVNKEIRSRGYNDVKKDTETLSRDIDTIKAAITTAKSKGERVFQTDYDQKKSPAYARMESLEKDIHDLSA